MLTDDSNFDEWPRWFNAAGVDCRIEDARYFNDDNMLLEAAIAGQRVTLARAIIARDDLDAGRLVRPFDITILLTFQYDFVYALDRIAEPNIQAFHDWLRQALH